MKIEQLVQFSQRSSTINGFEGKILTETTNENNQIVSSPLKKQKTFGFQEVSSELSDSSFQMRKRAESHISHFKNSVMPGNVINLNAIFIGFCEFIYRKMRMMNVFLTLS